jgi:hypothetical protein
MQGRWSTVHVAAIATTNARLLRSALLLSEHPLKRKLEKIFKENQLGRAERLTAAGAAKVRLTLTITLGPLPWEARRLTPDRPLLGCWLTGRDLDLGC